MEGGLLSRLRGIVKNDAEGVASTRSDAAHAMAHVQAVITPSAGSGPVACGKNDDLPLFGRDRLPTRLRQWPLLNEEKLAAGVIDIASTQKTGELQRKGDLPIEVLVQAIVATRLVA